MKNEETYNKYNYFFNNLDNISLKLDNQSKYYLLFLNYYIKYNINKSI